MLDCGYTNYFQSPSVSYLFSYHVVFSVNVLSMVISFPVTGAVYGFYINNRVWDYAITITILHMFASCFGKLALTL